MKYAHKNIRELRNHKLYFKSTYISHGKQSLVKEEDDSQEREENAKSCQS